MSVLRSMNTLSHLRHYKEREKKEEDFETFFCSNMKRRIYDNFSFFIDAEYECALTIGIPNVIYIVQWLATYLIYDFAVICFDYKYFFIKDYYLFIYPYFRERNIYFLLLLPKMM